MMMKHLHQAQSIALVSITFYLLAPILVRLTYVIGKGTSDFVRTLWDYVRGTCHEVVHWAKRNTVLDEDNVLDRRVQLLSFLIVSRKSIKGILQDGGMEKDRVKAIQEGKIVKVATEAVGIRIFRPRPMFALGAYTRALQLCTAMQCSFSPSIGVSAVINFGALNIMRVKWVTYFVIGWATTPQLWKLFGARRPTLPPTPQTTAIEAEEKLLGSEDDFSGRDEDMEDSNSS
eukprot:CAMPEP_0116021786 /NCGR_PEP_ID=MMETSP0321-20121206/10597_1 /TAXON_ID=163516 /ORGANISM="Leptocylindrus danicus var. danicus, Strain B650" /LENGTH=230 /DNA_ID=CAMNT_0003492729 /DNA_START=346 /DNA_END=1038 /DNA_ORIENTATION=+